MKIEEDIINIYKSSGLTPEECVKSLAELIYTASSSLPDFDGQITVRNDRYNVVITEIKEIK